MPNMKSITNSKIFISTKEVVLSTLSSVMPFLALTVLLASGHWILIRSYATYCAPPGLGGLVYTWFSTGSPVCQFINHWVASRLTSAKSVYGSSSVPMATTSD